MDAVADIKSRLSIEDIVSEYVQLKRAGRNFKGLSPFTAEKSPSFIVSPEKQIWHDFSSGRGGDVFSFVMEVEGLDFKGALELLARKAGVDLDQYRTGNQKKSNTIDKNRLFNAVEHAVIFYQKELLKQEKALRYLRETRGYEKQTIVDFRFGFSPNSGTALFEYLSGKGYTKEELSKAGLVSNRAGRLVDMFRDRIMIPLLDPEGRAVGFTARTLSADTSVPKYINTPATILYDKGRQVFGLSLAKEAIRKSGYAVVVEGNLDVVASHQAGVKQVVASAGTALTPFHLKTLKRFTSDIRLAFDEDRAGQEAVLRTIPIAQDVDVTMSIIDIPAGKDPDELIKKDPTLWVDAVSKSQYMMDWLVLKMADRHDITSALGKRRYSDELVSIIHQLKDEVEQQHYLKLVADKTNTQLDVLMKKFTRQNTPDKRLKPSKVTKQISSVDSQNDQRVREQHLLAICLHSAAIAKLIVNVPIDVFSTEAQDVARYITQHPGVSPIESEYGKMLSLLYEEYYQHTDEEELMHQSKHLLSRLITSYAKTKKQSIIQTLDQINEQDQATSLLAIKHLDDLALQFQKKVDNK